MFDVEASQDNLIAAIRKLDPWILGLRPSPRAMEGRAQYIADLTKLVAQHVEELAADADASQSCGQIDEEDARAIADTGADLAGQIRRAADAMADEVAA